MSSVTALEYPQARTLCACLCISVHEWLVENESMLKMKAKTAKEFCPPGFIFNCATCCFNDPLSSQGMWGSLLPKVTRKAFVDWLLVFAPRAYKNRQLLTECFTGNVQFLCIWVLVLVRNVYTACRITSWENKFF